MTLNFRKKKQDTGATASVVDGKMILSLPDALNPIVWQMDLNNAKASALEIQHDEEKNEFTLKLRTPKGESLNIAAFTERHDALEGLMAASSALKNAHGKIQIASANDTQSTSSVSRSVHVDTQVTRQSTRGKVLKALLAIVVLFICFTIWTSTIPRSVNTGSGAALSNSAQTSPQTSSGVPVSADDFLKGQ